jgi:phosphatidylglycerophosphate synthase
MDNGSNGEVSQRVRSAVVVGSGPHAAVAVAGVPLAVRAVMALHEAGFGDVALLAPGHPSWAAEPLARRGIPVRWIAGPAEMASSASRSGDSLTLLLSGDVLVDATALRDLRGAAAGSVWTAAGRLVGVVCPSKEAPLRADRAGFRAESAGPEPPSDASLAGTRIATGLAVPLEAAGSAARLERVLLDHLADRASGDSYLAALLDRPMSRPLTRLLLRTWLAPSHVTIVGVAIGILGALGLATVSYWGRLLGVLLLVASLVLDCVDGDMARARLAQGSAGARLDLLGDYLVNLAVFGALAVGLLREGLPPGGAWAALALLTGVGAAMAAVHALLIRPVLRRGGDLHWAGDDWSLRGKPGATVVEKLASRDYTYLLLVLAIVGHLEWFLYAAAAGAWVFAGIVVAYGMVTSRGRRPGAVSR